MGVSLFIMASSSVLNGRFRRWLKPTLLLLVIFVPLSFTPLLGNFYSVITGHGFEIPDESSLWTFNVTEMNPGSGEWWLYGEDRRYFYAYSETERVRYHAFPKAKIRDCPGFQSNDSKTWCPVFTIDHEAQ